MFRRLMQNDDSTVRIEFEGHTVSGRTGDTVAAALLEAGQLVSRQTAKERSTRGPFCMMGVCFDCLMVIDGQANRQACQTIIREGMQVAHQDGARRIAFGREV